MEEHSDLNQLRKRLDDINASLVTLLNERAFIATQVGARKGDAPVYVPSREAAILDGLSALNEGPLLDEDLRAIFIEIISACRNLQRQMSVAYLGPAGTYSEEAARSQLGTAGHYMPYDTIDAVFRAAEKGETTVAVVPVENSVEGPVGQTLDALRSTSLTICGEITLPIHHQLLTNAKALSEIKEVTAHPQALAQCRQWLQSNLPGVSQHSASSNAEAARLATESDGMAAIASKAASQLYGLPIIAGSIEDEPSNTTRFLVLGGDSPAPTGNDRTSILCSVPNEAGSLYRLLAILADNGVSMTKLESRPVRNEPWQ